MVLQKQKIILGIAQDDIVFFRCLFIPKHDLLFAEKGDYSLRS
jgi:hypothetical protein